MNFAAKTDKGKVRDNNEDFYFVKDNIMIVADGMGGHNAGEVASKLAVEIAYKVLCESEGSFEEKIGKAICEANREVHSMATGDRAGMGTTIDIGIYDNGCLYIGHVGDSRVYVIRDMQAEKITEDHSYVEMLVSKGELTKEEAENYPMKNMITRAIGVDETVECDFYRVEVKKGDKVLFCTDGLSNMVSEERMTEIVSEKNVDDAVNILVKEAIEAGGKDNITVIAAENFDL